MPLDAMPAISGADLVIDAGDLAIGDYNGCDSDRSDFILTRLARALPCATNWHGRPSSTTAPVAA